jgi:hypothetical protein
MSDDQRPRARTLVRQAVANGMLTRPAACDRCGTPGPVHGHHDDYGQPLAVRWLCRGCHALAHPAPAQARAKQALRADPARSDRLIGALIGVEHHAVSRARARLEASGQIPPAPRRAQRFPNGPRQLGRAQQAAASLGPQATTREVMELSGVGRHAAWHARTHPRDNGPVTRSAADAAAATDALAVLKTPAPHPVPHQHRPSGWLLPAAG